ncbi:MULTISPECIES: DUF4917 family protein [Acinetobacter]|uniref:DUF4917 domain-containing protein n=1 Tax=Acinetobacter schindleri CIP 107287 TaxID=1217988 RepID=N8Z678_9GAMM|nr:MULTISPECIES: DUF4917 family protein [Acinetobacter]ENV44436.1 hypothetical protein F955_01226 [Acinetobacter schindleri CIP 107287]ENX00161.1 hypothetical protein F899_02348 [Acinetobacter sp. CIP 101934]MCU4322051.1 DUF4917 family protein [Acinetobacter schindleri]
MTDNEKYSIKEWVEIKDNYRHSNLIIGNGASITLHSKFGFSSLKAEAEKLKLFSEDISKLFVEFDTCDFELILRLVWHAKLVNKHLGIVDPKIDSAYENIKQALIEVVKEVHCEHAQIVKQLPILYKFTKQFSTIVSLNYDLILHWIRMYGNEKNNDGHVFKDGFKNEGIIFDRWDYLKTPYYRRPYEKEITRTFYQHGNLTLFRYANKVERKVKRKDQSDLLEIIEKNWVDDNIPIFVAEGTSVKKMDAIRDSNYLSKVFYEILPEFLDDGKNLVIYGWGLGEQEHHLVKQIFKNKADGKVAISVFKNDQDYCYRVKQLINKLNSKIEIEFLTVKVQAVGTIHK